jgi:hypothetical protein
MGSCKGPCLKHCYGSNMILYLSIGSIFGFIIGSIISNIIFKKYQEKQ